MRLGIIGLPNSRKTTIFNALTGGDYQTSAASSGAEMKSIPRPSSCRMNASISSAACISRARPPTLRITYVDIGGLDKGIGAGGLYGTSAQRAGAGRRFPDTCCATLQTIACPILTSGLIPPVIWNPLMPSSCCSICSASLARLERIERELRVKGAKADKAIVDEKPALHAHQGASRK